MTGMPVTSVPLAVTKLHAPSFPHLPEIFAQAVPVLLHPAAVGPGRELGDDPLAQVANGLTADLGFVAVTELTFLLGQHSGTP